RPASAATPLNRSMIRASENPSATGSSHQERGTVSRSSYMPPLWAPPPTTPRLTPPPRLLPAGKGARGDGPNPPRPPPTTPPAAHAARGRGHAAARARGARPRHLARLALRPLLRLRPAAPDGPPADRHGRRGPGGVRRVHREAEPPGRPRPGPRRRAHDGDGR